MQRPWPPGDRQLPSPQTAGTAGAQGPDPRPILAAHRVTGLETGWGRALLSVAHEDNGPRDPQGWSLEAVLSHQQGVSPLPSRLERIAHSPLDSREKKQTLLLLHSYNLWGGARSSGNPPGAPRLGGAPSWHFGFYRGFGTWAQLVISLAAGRQLNLWGWVAGSPVPLT